MYVIDGIAYADNRQDDIKVETVRPMDDYKLWMRFSTGEVKIFDFMPMLARPVFQKLQDKNLFNTVYVDWGIPTWLDGEIDIAPETVYTDSVPLETDLTAEEYALIEAGDREFKEHPENFVTLESLMYEREKVVA
jgi:hypothetical protein